LTNLLKKFVVLYKWEGTCDEAFETLKSILVKVLMLKLLEFDKDFEIHSVAFSFTIKKVLVQERRPMAFENKNLSETDEGGQHMRRKCGSSYIVSRLGAIT
jgi:hypothetical protein